MAGDIQASKSNQIPEVNIEELDNKASTSNAPTEIVDSHFLKGLDANRYATKKTVAQGMLDIALLTSNASQLKYVLQVGPKHEFYMLLVWLISISIALQASAGVLALIISYMDGGNSDRQKRIAEWLYHTSVGLMTGVVFCDVMKMTFGLDPALSVQDSKRVISAIVAIILSTILNINRPSDQNTSEILNNVCLVFKVISIAINIIISIFLSIDVGEYLR